MLQELHICGLGVIGEATLELSPGLNVLTGETGAGKTMVTVALGLALGGRGSPALVREGGPGVAVEARFSLRHPLAQGDDLASWALDGEIVLARTLSREGRSGARVSGRLAPVATLATLGGRLVEIHGQSQAERLASPAAQTEFVDRFVGDEHLATLEEYRGFHAELRRARDNLRTLDSDAREREREKDLLAYQVREIEAAKVEPGELVELVDEESRLAHAERLLELTASAEAELADDGGALDRLAQAAEAARGVPAMDQGAAGLASRLASLAAEAADALVDLRAYRDGIEVAPGRLLDVRDRVHSLRSLERRYGDGEEGILAYLSQAAARLAALQDEEGTRRALTDRIKGLLDRHARLAAAISKARAQAAPALADLVRDELAELGLSGAALEIRPVALAEPGHEGAERVEFLFAGGPGQVPLPLGKVASGGELSRAMLACRSVLADLDDVPTLVFDEVDAGVGGRAAVSVARRLAALGRRRQVVVVTHLAQIAAMAHRHFVVTKEDGTACVRPVEDAERVREIARMLAGAVGEVSLAHAGELLAAGGLEREGIGAGSR